MVPSCACLNLWYKDSREYSSTLFSFDYYFFKVGWVPVFYCCRDVQASAFFARRLFHDRPMALSRMPRSILMFGEFAGFVIVLGPTCCGN